MPLYEIDEISNNSNNSALKQILRKLNEMDANLAALIAQVTQNTTIEASAVTLIQGIATQLTTALASGDSGALPALATQLNTSATALAAAIQANTPVVVVPAVTVGTPVPAGATVQTTAPAGVPTATAVVASH
jgi:hypothetical protein